VRPQQGAVDKIQRRYILKGKNAVRFFKEVG